MNKVIRHSTVILTTIFILLSLVNAVTACTVSEEAMPRIRETQNYIDYFELFGRILLVAIFGLFFLNLKINRQWKLALLFPLLGLVIIILEFVYVISFVSMGFCGVGEKYNVALTVLIILAGLFCLQLILFIGPIRNRKTRTV